MTMWGQALRKSRGSRVPIPWDLGIAPRPGNLMVVLGAPGVGKSLFALNWALSIDEPSLLVSLDTDMTTQALRATSILAGVTAERVAQAPEAWAQYLDRKNLLCRMYDLNLTTREINELVEAETAYWARPPSLVFVDNVANIAKDTGYEAYRATFLGLQAVARLHAVCVVALHHVKRDSSSGRLSLHSGQYSGEQDAEIVIGLWSESGASQPGLYTTKRGLNVGVLKNRHGNADPTGALCRRFFFDTGTLRMSPEE